jgi:photosynthetic reaction center cytochrome c subunit
MGRKNITRKILFALSIIAMAVYTTTALEIQKEETAKQDPPAEEAFKNIQVLRGVPKSGLMGMMMSATSHLGVRCTHCHVDENQFEKDDKPAKQIARKMFLMTDLIKKTDIAASVTCYTCHRGKAELEPPPAFLRPSEEAMKKAAEDTRPAEQVYKNVQTLKGVPVGRWMFIMNMFSKSLGVDCTYCHVENQFEKDDKPTKTAARRMLRMVGSIAREIYKGPTTINCYTCHRGQPKPARPAPAADAKTVEMSKPEISSRGALATVSEVLNRYVKSLGGRAAIESARTRVMKGTLETQGGMSAPLEVYQKAPNKSLTSFRIPGGDNIVGFDGATAWIVSPGRKPGNMSASEFAVMKYDVEFYRDIKLEQMFSNISVLGKAVLAGREAYVLEGTLGAGKPQRLYFDTGTGLLVRRDLEIDGPEGVSPLQMFYEDYREVDRILLPHVIRWLRPGFSLAFKYSEIQHDIPIDDAKFRKPTQ